MPGKHLNHDENRLLRLWSTPPKNLTAPFLISISVDGGLRGIDGLLIPFRYPISALCGKNGVGKTTILALAALAYHSQSDWQIPAWFYQPRTKTSSRSYYTISDFFLRSSIDRPLDDVTVVWTYRSHDSERQVKFSKTPQKWARYSKRPERAVAFIPMARMLAAHEVAGLRSTFAEQPLNEPADRLPDVALQQLGYVMGTQYSLAAIHSTKRHTFQHVSSNAVYTGFNMGAGESWIINLLYTLHTMPEAGLLVIEEIEAGLHAEAQKRLADVLIKICHKRRIQIICSTHSETFLDALPREARLLLCKKGADHEVFEAPSTRFATSEMLGVAQPEMTLYCEDLVARILIEEALSLDLRSRCVVREVGNQTTVIRQGISHLRSGYAMNALCVMDGDCKEEDIQGWIETETDGRADLVPKYYVLPGGISPEKWVIEQLKLDAYRASFSQQFGCTVQETIAYIESLCAEIDPHNLGFRLSQQTGIDSVDCIRRIMRSVVVRHPQLDNFREVIKQALG